MSLLDAKAIGLLSTAFIASFLRPGPGAAQVPALGRVGFELTDVADSGNYFLYRYRIVNPSSSRGGVGGISLDITVQGAGRSRLAFTGHLQHGAGEGEHGPIGAIAPDGWEMMTTYKGTLDWFTGQTLVSVSDSGAIPASVDSAAPGGSREGFGVRSPFLPGLRAFSAQPTYQACCMRANSRGEYPVPGEFGVTGTSVAPTIEPSQMTVAVLRAQLREMCASLGWIRQAACGRLQSAVNQNGGLKAFVDVLQGERGEGLAENAYWVLKTNAEYLLRHS